MSILAPVATAAIASVATRAVNKLVNEVSFAHFLHGSSLSDSLSVGLREPVSTAPTSGLSAAHRSDLLTGFLSQQRELVDRILEELRAAGIDVSEQFDLFLDDRGRIRLDNIRPDGFAIEQLLANSVEIRRQFHQAAASWRLVQAGERNRQPYRLSIE